MALTGRERQILWLHAKGLSDYRIAHELKMETSNVKRSIKNAIKKIERAKADIAFVDGLISQGRCVLTKAIIYTQKTMGVQLFTCLPE